MARNKVLVVDDDEGVVNMVQRMLRRASIASDAARSADEALTLMETTVYRVVVLDIHMPGMSGVDLIPALKLLAPWIQIIMLTGDTKMAQVIACLHRGAVDFFSKTDDLAPLSDAVAAALGRAARWISYLGSEKPLPEVAAVAEGGASALVEG